MNFILIEIFVKIVIYYIIYNNKEYCVICDKDVSHLKSHKNIHNILDLKCKNVIIILILIK